MSADEKLHAKCLRCGWHVRANDWLAADIVSDAHEDETGHETTTVADGELEFSKASEAGRA